MRKRGDFGFLATAAFSFAFVFLLVFSFSFVSAIPQDITVHGKLTDDDGVALSGSYSAVFKIYDEYTSGNLEVQKSVNLSVDSNGVYHVILESVNLPFDEDYFLEIVIASETLSPRINLTSSPYAYRAQNVSAEGIVFNNDAFFDTGTGGIYTGGDLNASGNLHLGASSTILFGDEYLSDDGSGNFELAGNAFNFNVINLTTNDGGFVYNANTGSLTISQDVRAAQLTDGTRYLIMGQSTWELDTGLNISSGNFDVHAGNVSATYFIGDGSYLTNLPLQGNIFDQSLNTSDSVVFGTVESTGTGTFADIYSDGGEFYTDGSGSVHASYLETYGDAYIGTGGTGYLTIGGTYQSDYELKVNGQGYFTGNITTDGYFIGDGSYLTGISVINDSYYLASNPHGFYNSTTLPETDLSEYYNKSSYWENATTEFLQDYSETDSLAYNGTLAYNSSLDNYYPFDNPYSYYNSTTLPETDLSAYLYKNGSNANTNMNIGAYNFTTSGKVTSGTASFGSGVISITNGVITQTGGTFTGFTAGSNVDANYYELVNVGAIDIQNTGSITFTPSGDIYNLYQIQSSGGNTLDMSGSTWTLDADLNMSENNVTADYFIGDGSQLTGVGTNSSAIAVTGIELDGELYFTPSGIDISDDGAGSFVFNGGQLTDSSGSWSIINSNGEMYASVFSNAGGDGAGISFDGFGNVMFDGTSFSDSGVNVMMSSNGDFYAGNGYFDMGTGSVGISLSDAGSGTVGIAGSDLNLGGAFLHDTSNGFVDVYGQETAGTTGFRVFDSSSSTPILKADTLGDVYVRRNLNVSGVIYGDGSQLTGISGFENGSSISVSEITLDTSAITIADDGAGYFDFSSSGGLTDGSSWQINSATGEIYGTSFGYMAGAGEGISFDGFGGVTFDGLTFSDTGANVMLDATGYIFAGSGFYDMATGTVGIGFPGSGQLAVYANDLDLGGAFLHDTSGWVDIYGQEDAGSTGLRVHGTGSAVFEVDSLGNTDIYGDIDLQGNSVIGANGGYLMVNPDGALYMGTTGTDLVTIGASNGAIPITLRSSTIQAEGNLNVTSNLYSDNLTTSSNNMTITSSGGSVIVKLG